MATGIFKVGTDWPGEMLDGDLLIRRAFLAGPNNTSSRYTVLATIEVIGGFEAFNTVPYHNYENWGQGYRGTALGISVIAEYLDDALGRWQLAYEKTERQG